MRASVERLASRGPEARPVPDTGAPRRPSLARILPTALSMRAWSWDAALTVDHHARESGQPRKPSLTKSPPSLRREQYHHSRSYRRPESHASTTMAPM